MVKKCAYLGCENEGTILDDIEVAQVGLRKDMYVRNTKGNLQRISA